MAATESEIETQWSNIVAALRTVRGWGEVDTPNLLSLIDTIDQSLEGDFTDQARASLGNLRARFSAVLGTDTELLNYVLSLYARFLDTDEVQPQRLIDLIYDYFWDNYKTIASRGMTLATPSADGDNTGTGDLLRLKVDAKGYTIESGRAATNTAKVITDAYSNGGSVHEEVIQLSGGYASRDLLELDIGSGDKVNLTALTHRNAGTLANAGFEQVTSASPPAVGSPQALTAAPTSWELVSGTIGNIEAQADTPWKSLEGETLPIALRFKNNVKIRQRLSTNRVRIDPTRPYLLGIGMKRENSATGTATLALENWATGTAIQSIAQSIGSLTDDTWDFVYLTLGAGCWFENFNVANLAVSLAVASLAVDYISFDSLVFAPGTFFDGSWYWAVGGATAWLRGDKWSWTDTQATGPLTGARQRTLAHAYGRYLPHAAPATEITAAGGRTFTFAASGKTITLSSGSLPSDGYARGMKLVVAGTSNNNGTFTIEDATATVLTVSESLTNEGPVSSTATLNATASLVDPA